MSEAVLGHSSEFTDDARHASQRDDGGESDLPNFGGGPTPPYRRPTGRVRAPGNLMMSLQACSASRNVGERLNEHYRD